MPLHPLAIQELATLRPVPRAPDQILAHTATDAVVGALQLGREHLHVWLTPGEAFQILADLRAAGFAVTLYPPGAAQGRTVVVDTDPSGGAQKALWNLTRKGQGAGLYGVAVRRGTDTRVCLSFRFQILPAQG